MDLKDFVSGLLADARKERAANKRTRKRKPTTAPTTGTSLDTVPEIVDPWHKVSVVLLTTHTTCKCCGQVMIGCEPHLFLEMFKGTRGKGTFVRRLERITNYSGKWNELYAILPKRTEPRLVQTDACPWCFGLEVDDTGLHYTTPLPTQQEFIFDEELPQVSH